MNIDKKELPILRPFQTFVVLREGLEPIYIENPTTKEHANEIFDLIVRTTDSHNFRSLKVLLETGDYCVVMMFVDVDDETGIELDAEDIELLARWLEVIPPPTIDEILEEVVNERKQLNMEENEDEKDID